MTIRILAWPAVSKNPYIEDLYTRIQAQDPTVEVQPFQVTKSWRQSAEVVHVHWPEAAVESPSTLKAFAKTMMVLATLIVHKLRGAVIVWTCHNLKGHDRRHPRLEGIIRRVFDPLVGGVIHLSEHSQDTLSSLDRFVGVPSTVVPHGHAPPEPEFLLDASDARSKLGLDLDLPVLAFVGFIRPYKNVPELIAAFDRMETKAQLVVAGNPFDEQTKLAVTTASAGVDRLLLKAHWLTDGEIADVIRASDVVMLAYRDVHNSGAAVMAASYGRPVVVNPVGSLAGFGAAVGEEWVYPLTAPLSGPVLDEIVEWALTERTSEPSMAAFDPDEAAARTAAFYHQLADD